MNYWLYGDEGLLQPTLQACTKARYFHDKAQLVAALRSQIDANTMVVIKDLHANKMETILQHIIQESAC